MLADFVTELVWKEPKVLNGGKQLDWVLYSDGLSNRSWGGVGIILEGPEGVIMDHSLCFDFQMTNNQVEYEALIVGLKLAKNMSIKSLVARSDS